MLMPIGALPPVNGPLKPILMTSALVVVATGLAGAGAADVLAGWLDVAGGPDVAGFAASAGTGAFVCANAGNVVPIAQHKTSSADDNAAKAFENSGACFMFSPRI
jgi:hypothetical protein